MAHTSSILTIAELAVNENIDWENNITVQFPVYLSSLLFSKIKQRGRI